MTGAGVQEKVVVRRPALADTVLIAGRCWHCRGLLVRERDNDGTAEGGCLDIGGVRCIECGEIFDPLVNPQRYQRARSQPQHRYYGR